MTDVSHSSLRAAVSLLVPLALAGTACSGIDAGIDYPSDLGDYEQHLLTPENNQNPSLGFHQFKFKPDLCKGIDTHTITQPITQEDFNRFLESAGVATPPKKARGNLHWYDFPNDSGGFVRLRLAVLADAASASKDLSMSLHEHGPGWWGLRRSNLAILAPKATLSEAVGFAVKHKLVCWGMFTIAGNDDAYVVPGPYMQL
jgi:hypothetical protein